MAHIYVAVGSNLGDRANYIEQGRRLLESIPEIRFLRSSPIYETEPIGGPLQGKFLNAVWEMETELQPKRLLQVFLEIEKILGRERGEKNGPRTLDLDLLFYGSLWVGDKELCIPHPRLHQRRFVLEPLADLVPQLEHPRFKKTIRQLLEEFNENCQRP